MKTCIYLSLLLFMSAAARSQDIIILKSGEEITSRVEEVLADAIKYRKFDNLTGPVYSIEKTKVFMIRYENGSKDVFTEEVTPAAQERTRSTGGELAAKSFNINPLGLLQFGPILQYEIKTSQNAVFAPYFRYAYLGVVSHVLYTGFEDGSSLSPASFGIGAGLKGFSTPVGNSFYYGGFAEFNTAKARYDIGETYETELKENGIAIVSNLGYRWRRTSGKYLNVGLFAGVYSELKSEERYVSDGSLESTDKGTMFFAMFELAFGW